MHLYHIAGKGLLNSKLLKPTNKARVNLELVTLENVGVDLNWTYVVWNLAVLHSVYLSIQGALVEYEKQMQVFKKNINPKVGLIN